MAHDIRVSTLLNAEEFLAFKSIADSMGQSQSSRMRQLVKADINEYVHKQSIDSSDDKNMVEPVQEQGT